MSNDTTVHVSRADDESSVRLKRKYSFKTDNSNSDMRNGRRRRDRLRAARTAGRSGVCPTRLGHRWSTTGGAVHADAWNKCRSRAVHDDPHEREREILYYYNIGVVNARQETMRRDDGTRNVRTETRVYVHRTRTRRGVARVIVASSLCGYRVSSQY